MRPASLSRQAFLIGVLACAAAFDAGAQAKWGAHPAPSDPQPAQPPASQRRWGTPPPAQRDPVLEERCSNLRRELEHARRLEQQGGTTGKMDQLSTQRQQLYEARQKAGC